MRHVGAGDTRAVPGRRARGLAVVVLGARGGVDVRPAPARLRLLRRPCSLVPQARDPGARRPRHLGALPRMQGELCQAAKVLEGRASAQTRGVALRLLRGAHGALREPLDLRAETEGCGGLPVGEGPLVGLVDELPRDHVDLVLDGASLRELAAALLRVPPGLPGRGASHHPWCLARPRRLPSPWGRLCPWRRRHPRRRQSQRGQGRPRRGQGRQRRLRSRGRPHGRGL
mmetsp:Transcript_69438/g.219361  ORF Transcript_69438/g.219361 Transcript_69438/m.219361 type:complete len:229 (+) Transcript_69438:270-956(+)